MEQESRAGCILHGCGVLAALAGLCAASGAACVFALTPGWRVWALPVFFLLALAGAACGLAPSGRSLKGGSPAFSPSSLIVFVFFR